MNSPGYAALSYGSQLAIAFTETIIDFNSQHRDWDYAFRTASYEGGFQITVLHGSTGNWSFGMNSNLSSRIAIGANTATNSQIRFLESSIDITTPVKGDTWFKDGALNFFDGTITHNILLVTIDTTAKTPTSTGVSGQVSYNTGFKYTCVATNTWVREAVDVSW